MQTINHTVVSLYAYPSIVGGPYLHGGTLLCLALQSVQVRATVPHTLSFLSQVTSLKGTDALNAVDEDIEAMVRMYPSPFHSIQCHVLTQPLQHRVSESAG